MGDGLPGEHLFTVRQGPGVPGSARVFLAGELDLAAVDLFADWTDQACQRLPRQVTLDLTGLTFVDATGARTLAAACACLRAHGRRVTVTGASSRVRHVFRVLGLPFGDHEVRPGTAGARAAGQRIAPAHGRAAEALAGGRSAGEGNGYAGRATDEPVR